VKPNPPYRDADMAALCAWLKKHNGSCRVSLKGDLTLRRLPPRKQKPPENLTNARHR
jgi:hypothetical protein